MAKSALAGEMTTKITVKRIKPGNDSEANPTEEWEEVFGGKVWCKWVYAHGDDVDENLRMGMGQTATITLRYTPKIDVRCRVWHENDEQTDENAWEVTSINDPEDRHKYLDILLRRVVVA